MRKLNKKMVSMKLSERARMLIDLLAEKHGMSATAVMEQAIREKAEREGVSAEEPIGVLVA